MAFPSDLLFYASYDSSLTADYSKNGFPIPNVIADTPTINTSNKQCGAGSLELDGANFPVYLRYERFFAPQASMGQQGSVVLYHYVDSTLANATILYLTVGDFTRELIVLHSDPNLAELFLDLYDGAGSFIKSLFHSGAPVDTWYHLEVNYDADSGDMRMFIDGILVESTTFTPTSIGTDTTSYDIGQRTQASGLHRIDDLQVWNTVQHTANFTPACVSFGPANIPLNTFGYPFGFPSKRGFAR